MNILLLTQKNDPAKSLSDLSRSLTEATVMTAEEIGPVPGGASRVDIILWQESPSNGTNAIEALLTWRTHPHTCLIPCWIAADPTSFETSCLWPRLAIDRFDPHVETEDFLRWLSEVAEWQQNRMLFPAMGALDEHGALELASGLALRKATGRLHVFEDDGSDGTLSLEAGCLVEASVKHLRGEEAFLEFLTWSHGSYQWEPNPVARGEDAGPPLDTLTREGLRLFRDANLLFHFLSSTRDVIVKTESESALDDGAVPYYPELKKLHRLIDGNLTAGEILEASPLSRLRTMSCLVKWFSMGDIVNASRERPRPKHRLLIVDDSPFMCRAIQAVFSQDPGFQIVGTAHNGTEALAMIQKEQPDVVTLDLVMPQMDGLTALKNIMVRSPKPVVILSAFTGETSRLTYESFKYGAVDVFTKPSRGSMDNGAAEARELRERVAQAARVRMEAAQYIRRGQGSTTGPDLDTDGSSRFAEPWSSDRPVILIYCGAGGFPLLLRLLFSLSPTATRGLPPLIICLAMSEQVVAALRPSLQIDSGMRFQEPVSGSPLQQGTAYAFSHDRGYRVRTEEGCITLERLFLNTSETSLDRLLVSASDCLGARLTVVAVSGTGDDGIGGLRHVHGKGGRAFVFSPDICLKPDLPRRILESGCAVEVETPSRMAAIMEDTVGNHH